MTDLPDLKPCPFCGNKIRGVEINCRGVGKVECGKCFAKFTFYAVHSLKDVKEAWNRRVGEEDKHEAD